MNRFINDNKIEKLIRKDAELLENGTSVIRRILQELTKELENYRYLQLEKEQQAVGTYYKKLSATKLRAPEAFFKKDNQLELISELIGKAGVIGEEVNRQTI